MRNFKTILFVVATTGILHAQDTIYTKAGKTINAKVYEVTQNEIRYQSSSNLEGPMYTIDKNQVSSIEYKNGTKDAFADEPSNSNQSQTNQSTQANSNPNNYTSDDVYNQGDPQNPAVVNNNYYTTGYPSTYYNPGVSLNFMFGMPSLFWGVPYYAGPWGGWPYYRSYYRPYWAYNYYRPWGWNGYAWGGGYHGYGAYGWGWRGNHVGGYYGGNHGGGHYGGYHGNGGFYGGPRGGGFYNGPRGHHSPSGGNSGGFNGGGHGFGGGGYHGGGGFHGGGGGFHGGGGHGFGGGGHHR